MTDLQKKHEIRKFLPRYLTPAKTLVETGSHEGNGIEAAFAWGFETVYSVEINMDLYRYCQDYFSNDLDLGRLFLFLGDSVEKLPLMLRLVSGPVTFWLDAHRSGFSRDCPLLDELSRIAEHPCKEHNILIDDASALGSKAFEGITVSQIEAALRGINPDYRITRESTGIENNVIAASVL